MSFTNAYRMFLPAMMVAGVLAAAPAWAEQEMDHHPGMPHQVGQEPATAALEPAAPVRDGPVTDRPVTDRLVLGEDAWVKAGVRVQSWYQGVFEDGAPDIHDFMVRRVYAYIKGQVMPRVTFFAHIAADRIGQKGLDNPGVSLGTGISVRDAWVTLELVKEMVKLQAGRMYVPFTRSYGTTSTLGLLTLDLPFSQGGIRGGILYPSTVGRDDSVTLWGNIMEGLVQYRLMLGQGSQDPTVNPDGNMRFAGRISVSLLDGETDWFNKGTYLGKKRVLSIGGGIDWQDQLVAGGNKDTYIAWTTDLFADYPVLGSGAVTFEGAYIGVKHGPTAVLGGADGTIWYAQAGFLVPRFVHFVQIQPYVKYESLMPKGGDNDVGHVSAGLNAFLKGHAAKLVVDYTAELPQADELNTRHFITVQLQAGL